MNVHFLLLDEIEQQVEGALVRGDIDFVGRSHFFCSPCRLVAGPKISLRLLSQPKTASRTRDMFSARRRGRLRSRRQISASTWAGCFSYSRRRARTGSIHLIKLSAMVAFAFDAADAGGAAAVGGPFERFRRREQFMPVVDGTHVGIAGVGAALARGVGDHDFGFGADVVVGFAESDGVAVALGHFAAVEAGDAGGLGEHDGGLGQDVDDIYKRIEIRNLFGDISDSSSLDMCAQQSILSSDLWSGVNSCSPPQSPKLGGTAMLVRHDVAGRQVFVQGTIHRRIKFADDFAAQFDVGNLVFADGDEERISCRFAAAAVDHDVGGLEAGIAEEAVGVEVFVF